MYDKYLPKSLEETEKRKCEKEGHTIFMGVYFREYKERKIIFYFVTMHIVSVGWWYDYWKDTYPRKGYEFLQYEIKTQLSTRNRSHIAVVLVETENFLAFKFPRKHPLLTFFS